MLPNFKKHKLLKGLQSVVLSGQVWKRDFQKKILMLKYIASGKVYHQSITTELTCADPGYINRLRSRIIYVYRMAKERYSNIWPNQTIVSDQSELTILLCQPMNYICRILTAAAWYSDLQLLPSYIWSLISTNIIQISNNFPHFIIHNYPSTRVDYLHNKCQYCIKIESKYQNSKLKPKYFIFDFIILILQLISPSNTRNLVTKSSIVARKVQNSIKEWLTLFFQGSFDIVKSFVTRQSEHGGFLVNFVLINVVESVEGTFLNVVLTVDQLMFSLNGLE